MSLAELIQWLRKRSGRELSGEERRRRAALAKRILFVVGLSQALLYLWTQFGRIDAPAPDEAGWLGLPPEIPAKQNVWAGLVEARGRYALPDAFHRRFMELRKAENFARADAQALLSEVVGIELLDEILDRPRFRFDANWQRYIQWSASTDSEYTGVDWGFVFRDVVDVDLLRAMLHAEAGRSDQATAFLARAFRFAEMGRESPRAALLGVMFAHSIRVNALETSVRIARFPGISPETLLSSPLSVHLERPEAAAYRRMWRDEYRFQRILLERTPELFGDEGLFEEDPWWMPQDFWYHPNRSKRLLLQMSKDLQDRVGQCPPNISAEDPGKPGKLEEIIQVVLKPNWIGRWFIEIHMQHLPRFNLKWCESDARTGATRLRLALLAHERRWGRLPSDAAELVPVFLDRLPVNPFDGEALRVDPLRRVVSATLPRTLAPEQERTGSPQGPWLMELSF